MTPDGRAENGRGALTSTEVHDRFWLRPKWVVGHVICLLLVVLFVNLGFWQLRRLDEKQAANATIETRGALPVEPVNRVIATTPPDELAYRRASATGRYDVAGEVLIRFRSLNEVPGRHVLTPMVLDDGTALAVNRGFLPDSVTGTPPPPAGEVEVVGLLLPSQQRQGLGPTDPTGGRLTELARADLGRLQQQYDRPLLPVYLQLERQAPPSGDGPTLLPPPETSEGPHLGYAGQWFLFALVGAVGWPLLLRRTAAEQRRAPPPDRTDEERVPAEV